MKSILEEFAYGNLSPEPLSFEHDSQYGKAMKTLTESEDKLLSLLGDAEKEWLRTFSDAQEEISLLSGVDRFIRGYKLGVLMTMEVFNGKDDLIVGCVD